jgi:hypothetical protein
MKNRSLVLTVNEEHEYKCKVVPVLPLTEHHAMKAYGGWRYGSTHSLTWALDGGEWSASRPE